MSYEAPKDYVEVNTRIGEFRKQYPTGSLSRIAPDGTLVPVSLESFAGKDWAIYTAFAYRSPDDKNPGVGTAWEPVPGNTPFTKDSELQNAETAAWGRAMIAALAVDAKLGIASADEIEARKAPVPDWVKLIREAKTIEDLGKIHGRATIDGWVNAEVMAALTARKGEINAT